MDVIHAIEDLINLRNEVLRQIKHGKEEWKNHGIKRIRK